MLVPVKIENGASCERAVIKPSSVVPVGLWMIRACLAIAWGCVPALALERDRGIHQFADTARSVKDGAPSGIQALGQTQDGYLRVGATSGLHQFDGVSFERYQPQAGPALPSHGVLALLAIRVGRIRRVSYQKRTIAEFRRQRPDITLLDLRLPRANGTDALIAIRGRERRK